MKKYKVFRSVGFQEEIHPRILKNWKIKMLIALFEIDLEKEYLKKRFISGQDFGYREE